MPDPNSRISEERQMLYYGGMALTIIGLFLFFSVLVSGFQSASGGGRASDTVWVSPGSGPIPPGLLPPGADVRVGSPPPGFGSNSNSGPDFAPALIGFVIVAIGGVMMNIGRAGMRGSGIILDPHGAREDLKPWNQAAGEMLDDTLAASPIVSRVVENLGDKNEPQIRVRCLKCSALNDEDAKFCDECGASLR